MSVTTLQKNSTTAPRTLLVALEVSAKEWKLAFWTGVKVRVRTVAAADFSALLEEAAAAKRLAGLDENAPVKSCYEAGRDGFWIHRELVQLGWENVVMDSSSIQVDRRKRRVKNDKVDAENLVNLLRRQDAGERKVFSMVRVPSVDAEDARRPLRELDRMRVELGTHSTRIKALLVTQGVKLKEVTGKRFLEQLKKVEEERAAAGRPLLPNLLGEVRREHARREEVVKQRAEVCAALEAQLLAQVAQRSQAAAPPKPGQPRPAAATLAEKVERLEPGKPRPVAATPVEKVERLAWLRGIGMQGAWVLVVELFGWREFRNRREVGALLGLTPTPYSSGDSDREQGISKAGRPHLRRLLNQLAWGWLRHQPQSALSQWYQERFADGKRAKRRGITAVSRRLAIALWRYVEQGVLPEGATLKSALVVKFSPP